MSSRSKRSTFSETYARVEQQVSHGLDRGQRALRSTARNKAFCSSGLSARRSLRWQASAQDPWPIMSKELVQMVDGR